MIRMCQASEHILLLAIQLNYRAPGITTYYHSMPNNAGLNLIARDISNLFVFTHFAFNLEL